MTYVTPGHPIEAGAGYDCQCGECVYRRTLAGLAGPDTDRACTECGTVYVSDPGGVCSDCLPDVAARVPGSISQDQRRQIAVLLLEREPVARAESMADFINGILGPGMFRPSSSLWDLSAKQGGDLLEALENERRGRGLRAVDYRGKRHVGGPARRPSRGAHRA